MNVTPMRFFAALAELIWTFTKLIFAGGFALLLGGFSFLVETAAKISELAWNLTKILLVGILGFAALGLFVLCIVAIF